MISSSPFAYVDTGALTIGGPMQDIQTIAQALNASYDSSTGLVGLL